MKWFWALFLAFAMCLTFAGCSSDEYERDQLQAEIENLQEQKESLETQISDLQATWDDMLTDDISYVIELEISQTHLTLDLDEYLKDATNKITIPIEVSKKYYYSVDVGDVINDDLRVGSLLFKGSFGSWHVEVTDKQIVENTTD